jgi:hypothetical protein
LIVAADHQIAAKKSQVMIGNFQNCGKNIKDISRRILRGGLRRCGIFKPEEILAW